MNHKKPLLFLSVVFAAIVGLQLASASLNLADANEPVSEVLQSIDNAAMMSQPADDSAAKQVEINLTVDQAVPCAGCVSAGSGCSGSCPNAPGPRRQCRNVAPSGKPKICSCTSSY